MNDAVLKALIAKWKRDAVPPEVEDGSAGAAVGNALSKGVRIAIEKCATDLEDLIRLLGEQA